MSSSEKKLGYTGALVIRSVSAGDDNPQETWNSTADMASWLKEGAVKDRFSQSVGMLVPDASQPEFELRTIGSPQGRVEREFVDNS